MRFACLISLRTEVSSRVPACGEESGKDRLDQRAEDDLCSSFSLISLYDYPMFWAWRTDEV